MNKKEEVSQVAVGTLALKAFTARYTIKYLPSRGDNPGLVVQEEKTGRKSKRAFAFTNFDDFVEMVSDTVENTTHDGFVVPDGNNAGDVPVNRCKSVEISVKVVYDKEKRK